MPEKKERLWQLEGHIPQRLVVQARGATLSDAVAAAESGDWVLVEELKSDDTSFTWYDDTDVEVSEDGENFDPNEEEA
jgi:hypothetical protein